MARRFIVHQQEKMHENAFEVGFVRKRTCVSHGGSGRGAVDPPETEGNVGFRDRGPFGQIKIVEKNLCNEGAKPFSSLLAKQCFVLPQRLQ